MYGGVPISYVCPLGQVHKDGHAILYTLTFAMTEDEKDVYDGTDSYILQSETPNLGKSIGTNRTIMHNNKKNEELQTRREFFKRAAKGALPILGAIVLANAPVIMQASEKSPMGCTGTCYGTCYGSCKGCSTTCSGTCSGSCKVTCSTTCSGTCSGSCRNTCTYANR